MTWMDVIGCAAVAAPGLVCWVLTLCGALDDDRA